MPPVPTWFSRPTLAANLWDHGEDLLVDAALALDDAGLRADAGRRRGLPGRGVPAAGRRPHERAARTSGAYLWRPGLRWEDR